MPAFIDDQTCPLCGQTNGCAVALGNAPEQCWCMQTIIDPHVLATPAVQAFPQRCICPSCAQLTEKTMGPPTTLST